MPRLKRKRKQKPRVTVTYEKLEVPGSELKQKDRLIAFRIWNQAGGFWTVWNEYNPEITVTKASINPNNYSFNSNFLNKNYQFAVSRPVESNAWGQITP